MSKNILSYLFGDSQLESEIDDSLEQLEALAEELEADMTDAEGEPIKIDKQPLAKALASLGLKGHELGMDPEGFFIVTGKEDEYRNLVVTLAEPAAMEKLATAGWVAHKCGDQAMSMEEPEFKVRFIEISVADTATSDKPSEKVKSIIQKGREFATTPMDRDDKENPVEHPEATNKKHAGMSQAKDGAEPEGKPKGSGKSESQQIVDALISDGELTEWGRHKPDCQCGFCKNKGSFGKKKKDDEKPEGGMEEPESKEESLCQVCGTKIDFAALPESRMGYVACPKCSTEIDQTGEPARFEKVQEELARRRGRPKNPPTDKPVADRPTKPRSVPKAYKTPKRAK